jgi:hypothetical protein
MVEEVREKQREKAGRSMSGLGKVWKDDKVRGASATRTRV